MAAERKTDKEKQAPDLGIVGKRVRRTVLRNAYFAVVSLVLVAILFLWATFQVWQVGLKDAVVNQERAWGHRYVDAEASFMTRRLESIETSLRRFGATALSWQNTPGPSTQRLSPRGQSWIVKGDDQNAETIVFAHPTSIQDIVGRAGGSQFDPQARGQLLVDPAIEAAGIATLEGALRRLPSDHLEDRIRDRQQLLNLKAVRESARTRGRAVSWYTGGSLSNTPPAQQAGASFPVMNEGSIVAVVFVEVDAQQFLPIISTEEGEWSLIVDSKAVVVAADSLGAEVMARVGTNLTRAAQRPVSTFGNRLLEKESGEWQVSTRKGTWLCSYVTLPKQGWKLVLARPTGMPEGAAQTLSRNALIATILLSLILLALLPLVRFLLNRRAVKLAQTADEVVELLETSLDEVGRDIPLTAAGEDRFPELEGLLSIIRHTARDIGTQRRESSRERERLATILRSLDVGVAVMDRRFSVVYANDVVLNRHGDQIRGKRASWIVEDNPWEGADDARMVMEDGSPHTVRKQIQVSGEQRVYQVTYFPIINAPGGRVEGFGEVTTDVTELAHLQSELKRLADDLQDKNEILNKNNALLQRADRVKSEFIGNVSHELRTPMNTVLGYSRILLRQNEKLDDSTRETLEQIEAAATRLMELIEALLELTRLDAGSIKPRLRSFPVLDLAEELEREFTPKIEAKGLNFVLEAPPSNILIQQDYERMHQVLIALLNNAIKFTEEGDICLGIKRDSDFLEIYVRDTGVGIPSDELAHIFERFHMSDGSVTRRHGGIGLGLTLALRLTEMLGGTIRVDSAEEEGTTFTIRVPRDLEAAIDQANATTSEVNV